MLAYRMFGTTCRMSSTPATLAGQADCLEWEEAWDRAVEETWTSALSDISK